MEATYIQNDFAKMLEKYRVIAILRHMPPEQTSQVFDALYDGGIRMVEITMNSDSAARQIQQQHERLGRRMFIGAGTVTTTERAKAALEAGAQFLVTPNVDLAIIELARSHQIPILPGAMTPSEMMQAVSAGIHTIKLFPAAQMGLDYVKAVKAPLDDIHLVAVGGISPDQAGSWVQAGCIAVGMGSSLMDMELIRRGEFEKASEQIAAFLSEFNQSAS